MKFNEAQRAMIAYLASTEFATREDAVDTQASIRTLQEINRLGLITTNSQEGKRSERAYVDGVMRSASAYALVKWLEEHTDKLGFILRSEDTPAMAKTWSSTGAAGRLPTIAVTRTGTTVETSIPLVVPVAVYKGILRESRVNLSEDVAFVICVDPVYGRAARTGLYRDVLRGLRSL